MPNCDKEQTMAITITEGAAVDPAALQALYEHAPWARGRTVDGIRRMLAHTDYHFSAWDGQRLVGFARVLTHPVLSTVEKFWLNTRDKSAFYEKFGFVRSDQGMVRDHHP